MGNVFMVRMSTSASFSAYRFGHPEKYLVSLSSIFLSESVSEDFFLIFKNEALMYIPTLLECLRCDCLQHVWALSVPLQFTRRFSSQHLPLPPLRATDQPAMSAIENINVYTTVFPLSIQTLC